MCVEKAKTANSQTRRMCTKEGLKLVDESIDAFAVRAIICGAKSGSSVMTLDLFCLSQYLADNHRQLCIQKRTPVQHRCDSLIIERYFPIHFLSSRRRPISKSALASHKKAATYKHHAYSKGMRYVWIGSKRKIEKVLFCCNRALTLPLHGCELTTSILHANSTACVTGFNTEQRTVFWLTSPGKIICAAKVNICSTRHSCQKKSSGELKLTAVQIAWPKIFQDQGSGCLQ